MTMSGGSLCAGTCRLTIGSLVTSVPNDTCGVIRLRQCSVPSASQISHRYAQHRSAAKTSNIHSSSPPTVLAAPRWLLNVQSSAYVR
jgi:hypothetical protein